MTNYADDGTRNLIRDTALRFMELQSALNQLFDLTAGNPIALMEATEGFDKERRRAIQEWTHSLDARDLIHWANRLDVGFSGGGRQRAVRAIELVLLTGKPLSYWQEAAREAGEVEPWYVVLTVPRQVLHQRIERRAREMVRRGLIEEVAAVLSEGHPPHAPGLDGIGMREAVEYLHGKRSRDSVADAIAASTRRYAKRQETWFRHQLRGDLLMLDAVRPPDQLAEAIATRWRRTHGE